MQNTNKNRRGKVAAIFLALLVTATAVPAMSISALAAENNITTQTRNVGGTYAAPTSGGEIVSVDVPDSITDLTYAYDVSRSGSPDFENTVDLTVLGAAFVDPKSASEGSVSNAVQASSSELNCTLTKLGKYADLKNSISIKVARSTLSELADYYNLDSLDSLDDFTIYELKGIDANIYSDGNTNELRHISYGIITSYNDANGRKTVSFMGWMGTSSMAWGTLLSSTKLQNRQTVSTTINVYPVYNQYIATAPIVKTGLTSTGGPQGLLDQGGLISDGNTDYEMSYCVKGPNDTAFGEWTTSAADITGTAAGTYTIRYRAADKDGNTVGDIKELTITIAESVTPPASQHTNHCVCNGTASGIGEHTCDNSTQWKAVTDTDNSGKIEKSELPTTGGNYYLTKDVEIGGYSWTPPADTNLCLNGHTIEFKRAGSTGGTDRAIAVTKGDFSLTDCNDTETHKYSSVGQKGLWQLDEETGTNTLAGGALVGDKNYYSYGVYVKDGKTFNMYGGNIVGFEGKPASAGSSARTIEVGGTFNLYGGTIAHNYAKVYGAVKVSSTGKFTMNGGTITENKVEYETSMPYGGSGVYVAGGEFTMNDGEITNNTAEETYGGGIYCSPSSKVAINGGIISGNTATVMDGYTTVAGGDGIYLSGKSEGAYLNISDSTAIKDEILLSEEGYVTFTKAIQSSLTFGVESPKDGRIIAKGTGDYSLTEDDLNKITLKDVNGFIAELDKEHNAIKLISMNLNSLKPTRAENLTYEKNKEQQLLQAPGTVPNDNYVIKYRVTAPDGTSGNWVTDYTQITGENAGDYTVEYQLYRIDGSVVNEALGSVSVTIKKAYPQVYTSKIDGLKYTGQPQQLVTVTCNPEEDNGTGYTVKYAVTVDDQKPALSADVWLNTIPEEINAGEYYVWYKIVGSDNYSSSTSDGISCTRVPIAQAEVTVTPPTALNPTYNGNEQEIAKPGSLSCTDTKADGNFFTSDDFGKLVYAVTAASAENCPATLFDNVPKETEVGEYKVWYGVGNVTDQKKNFKYVLADGSEITGYDNYIEASIKEKESTSSGGGGSAVTTYSITFNTNGGSSVQTQWVTSGGKLSNLPTTTKEGYTFAGWYTDEALTQPFSADTAITKNTVLYAKWTEKADPTDPGEGVTVGQVTGLKAIKKTTTTLKLTFNKVEGVSGYEIYDAETNELLTTCTTQKGKAKLVKTITGLNAGEVRKYKVRAYVIVNGEKHYGAFSKVYTKATAERTPVLLATAVKTTGTSVKLRWTPVDGAAKYQVYGGICSETPVRLKTVSGETTDWTSKSLKRATSYKYYVVALDEAGKKIATSPIIHVVTNGSKYGNPEQLTLTSDAAITMTKGGKVANVLTELTASPAEKEPLTHIAALRYRSDDKTVAKVDKDGVITAVNKGTCTVYVIAQNGLYQAVTVTVE